MTEDGLYEWDAAKAAANVLAHDGITFEEAITVLESVAAVEARDASHPSRVNTVGWSATARALFVVTTEVTESGRTRIISARKASKHEIQKYLGK